MVVISKTARGVTRHTARLQSKKFDLLFRLTDSFADSRRFSWRVLEFRK
jgi:hypothetical protein